MILIFYSTTIKWDTLLRNIDTEIDREALI